jgi:hypothetical protein
MSLKNSDVKSVVDRASNPGSLRPPEKASCSAAGHISDKKSCVQEASNKAPSEGRKSQKAKAQALEQLQTYGLPHGWEGDGHPTYHGGGFQQYQHRRVSAYTMVSDWLFDLKSISEGHKNVPALNLDSVQDSFAAAGIVYDELLDLLDIPRASIIQGYVSHLNPSYSPANDWRGKHIQFTVMLPDGCAPHHSKLAEHAYGDGIEFGWDNGALVVSLEVGYVLDMAP